MTAEEAGKWIGGREAARRFGVHENTIRNWANEGRLTSRKLPKSGFRRYDRAEVEQLAAGPQLPSYHDLHITTDDIPRTAISDLPFGVEVYCNRVTGWQVRDYNQMIPAPPSLPNLPPDPKLIGGEFDRDPDTGKGGLRLDVAGHVICDSLTEAGAL